MNIIVKSQNWVKHEWSDITLSVNTLGGVWELFFTNIKFEIWQCLSNTGHPPRKTRTYLQDTQQGFECMNVTFNKIKNQMDKIEAILINLPRFTIKGGKRNLGS
jgi:hypothetical protein